MTEKKEEVTAGRDTPNAFYALLMLLLDQILLCLTPCCDS